MKKQAYALIAALVLFAAPAFGQGWNVELVSERYENWSYVDHIAKAGDYVYLGLENGGLAVVDVSDLADPMEVAFLLPETDIHDIEIEGIHAYLATSDGLLILDISNPANPVEIAQVIPERSIGHVCLSQNMAYLIHNNAPAASTLKVLDVSNPANPALIGTYNFPEHAADPAASGNYLYVPMWSGGLWILDVSTPSNPTLVGSLGGLTGSSYEIAVSNGVAYLALSAGGLYTIDISDPTHPTVLGQAAFGDNVDAVEVSGTLAYVGTISDGLFIVDVSQPSHPVILGNYAGPGYNSPLRQLVVEEPYVYGAWYEYHLRITDVSDPQNPTPLSSYYTNWWIGDVAWQGNYAYLAAGNDGLLINDISDPANPWQAGYFIDMGYASDVLIRGNYAYVQTSTAPNLKIVDVSNPLNPRMAGSYNLQDGRIYKFVDNLAYATADEGILKILDLSDPVNPLEIGSYNQPGAYLFNLDTDGRFLYAMAEYVSNYSGVDSLLILDVNEPTNPQFLALYYSEDGDRDLVLGDGYLYASGGLTGFIVFSVADPAHPIQVGQLAMQPSPSDILLSGNFVYLTFGGLTGESLRIVDVSDPTNPVLTGYYDTEGFAQAVAVNGDYAYISDWDHFEIYDCSDALHNDVDVTITPLIQPIQIPASGGSFDYYIFAENNGPGSQTVDLWAKAILPGGSVLSPILGPVSVSLDSGTTGWIRHQNIPGRAPAGLYTYIACAGDYPNSIWTSDSLQFTKLASGDWGAGSGDWSNTGESLGSSGESFITHHSSLITSIRPNPFNPSTAISYQLSADSHVKLEVFDISGRLVATLADGWREAGAHEVTFDGSGLASGIYAYRLQAADVAASGKMLMMK